MTTLVRRLLSLGPARDACIPRAPQAAQKPAKTDSRIDERLDSLVGGDPAVIEKARIVVSGLDGDTTALLDRVAEIDVKNLAPQ